jgi:AraC-like DNA-binding protein
MRRPRSSTRPIASIPLGVPAAEMRRLCAWAFQFGLDLAEIARELNLPPSTFTERSTRDVSLADYFRVLERLQIASHDESWGLSKRPLLLGSTELVLSNLAHCGSLLDAMRAIAHTYNLLHGGLYNRIEQRKNRIVYIIDDRRFPYTRRTDHAYVRFMMECVLIYLHGLLCLISGDRLEGCLRGVVTKSAQFDQHDYLKFWPVPIRWRGPYYALSYDESIAGAAVEYTGPTPSAPRIYRRILDLIEHRQNVTSRLRSLTERVLQAFDESVYDQAAIARRLGVSVATLRRRLEEERQPPFRTLQMRALNRSARTLLRNRHHTDDIAERLGFSDARSFVRAFKRWNGVTPAHFARTAHQPLPTRTPALRSD